MVVPSDGCIADTKKKNWRNVLCEHLMFTESSFLMIINLLKTTYVGM